MRKARLAMLVTLVHLVNYMNGQSNSFELKFIYDNSDFNYSALKRIDEFSGMDLLDSVFNPVPGMYTLYRFDRLTNAETKDTMGALVNHELIMVKVLDNRVVESYYFPLDWKEPPLSSVLLVSRRKFRIKRLGSTKCMKFRTRDPNGVVVLKDGAMTLNISK